jgi:hypothetical protein
VADRPAQPLIHAAGGGRPSVARFDRLQAIADFRQDSLDLTGHHHKHEHG